MRPLSLLSSGWAGLGSGKPGSHVQVVGPLSHGQLFPRLAGVVHHGGASTNPGVERLASALVRMREDPVLRERAAQVGARVRARDALAAAVALLERANEGAQPSGGVTVTSSVNSRDITRSMSSTS